MELVQVMQQLYEVSQRLDKSANEIYKMAKKRAETERKYRMELSKEILKLKAEGMAATLIPDVARGNVSALKFERDLTEGQFRAALEALESLRTEVSALQSIVKHQTEV